ncbi:MFS transporter [Vibrio hepatarius]|uniref:MFS transporter n=1 Tax=Vibrio hepatarius TaxID=171383 RepID=UPI001C08AD1D|nr:MFS transporter [Vibrio hepatarius]MBU2899139.1 MFS transporter [Vibrio hepatarius]
MPIYPATLLFISSFLLMGSHGLSGILLPVSLAESNISVEIIGFILSMYSVGFLLGAILGKRILRRIGLVRTFAMCGSLGASAILTMGLNADMWIWVLMRSLMGFCIACATATLDVWFNSVSTQSNRGKLLAINQIVILSAITIGQFGLVIAAPSEITLFLICGVLFSISVTPVIFVAQFEPSIESIPTIPLKAIYTISPLGFITCFVCGVLYSTLINMLPVYAGGVGLNGFELSMFMGAATAGGILLQIPIGHLSDRFERRKVILGSSFVLAIVCFALPVSIEWQSPIAPFFLAAMTMGLIACLYPLSIAEAFDHSMKTQLVPVVSGLLCIYAIGAIIGPYTASLLMGSIDQSALFTFVIMVDLALITFIIYRMSEREALPVEEQETFVMHTPASVHGELDPRTDYQDSSVKWETALLQIDQLTASSPINAITFIRSLVNKQPQWAISLVERTGKIDNIDTTHMFRSLALTHPELSLDIANQLASSDDNQIEDLVIWLAEKQPENVSAILTAMTESIDSDQRAISDTTVANPPEQPVQTYQEIVASEGQAEEVDISQPPVYETMNEWNILAVSENPLQNAHDISDVVEHQVHKNDFGPGPS